MLLRVKYKIDRMHVDIETAPQEFPLPEARPTTDLEVTVDTNTVAQRLQKAERDEVKRTILREAVERYRHELLPDEERMLLLDRIKRLKKSLGL